MNQLIELLELPADTTPEALLVFVGGLKQEHAAQAVKIASLENRSKVMVPDKLRDQIVGLAAWLRGLSAELSAQRSKLETEISELEATGLELAMEAIRLDGETIRDTQAAVQLQAVNTRRGKITARVAELREELARISPPGMRSVGSVFDAIIWHWSDELPRIVQDHLGQFDPDPAKIAHIAKMFQAFARLRGLRSMSDYTRETLTPYNIQKVLAILARAERGQPMLLVDAD